MEDSRVKITADEVKQVLSADIDLLAEQIAGAMNNAKGGRIIADSETPVRDAHMEFRQAAYEKALSLLQAKQEAFSPSAQRDAQSRAAGGDPSDQ